MNENTQGEFKRTASADRYIQLNKKITNKEVIKIVADLSKEHLLTPTEICYRFITEGAIREKQKKDKLATMLRDK